MALKFLLSLGTTSGFGILEPSSCKPTALLVLGALVLTGCVSQKGLIPEPLLTPMRPSGVVSDPSQGIQPGAVSPSKTTAASGLQVTPTPAIPPDYSPRNSQAPITAPLPPGNEPADITFNFENLPLPQFIQAVYPTVLKKTVSVDPVLLTDKRLINLRSSKPMTASNAESMVKLLLKTYNVSVYDFGGLTRVVPETNFNNMLPEIRRGRSLPDTPLAQRPIFHMVELQAVTKIDIQTYLSVVFGTRINVIADPLRQIFLLSGTADDIAAALEVIQMLDQPQMKARSAVRISPQIWSAEELTKRLTEILVAEGYAVGDARVGSGQFPITLLPISGINTVIVFAQSKEITNHIVEWARELDKPPEKSVGKKYFSYQVKNTDASRLAETLSQLLGGARVPNAAASAPASSAAAATPSRGDAVTVDKSSNTLLFQSSGEEYGDIIRIVRELDKVTRQVMIEVTVAEVFVDDRLQTGVDWVFSSINDKGIVRQKSENSGNTVAGFAFKQFDIYGGPRATLSALATDNKATVRSSPLIFVRNGETGRFRSGREVPIVTSQLTTNNTGGNTSLIQNQTLQYRNTGTLVTVKPVIHSADSVELEINQEVSSVVQNESGVGNSPVFTTKNIETRMTLRHGETYVMGGLVDESISATNKGVPFAKDIPLLGRLFGSDNRYKSRTEFVMLVTPYILNDSNEILAISEAFRRQLGTWAIATEKLASPAAIPANP